MEIDWKVLASDAITQMLRIFLPVCIALILKWASDLWLKIKTSRPDIAKVIELAGQIGYSAAEDYFHDKDSTGEMKMTYAIERAESFIKEATGMSVDVDVIRDAITNYGVDWDKFSWTTRGYGKEDDSDTEPQS